MSFVKLQNDNGDLVFTGTSIRGVTPTMIGLGNVCLLYTSPSPRD